MSVYVIINKNNKKLYWSNTFGWGNLMGSSFFTEEETKRLLLPIEGEWKKLSEKREEEV